VSLPGWLGAGASRPEPAERRSRAAQRAADPQREAGVAITPAPHMAALHKGDPCFPTPQQICEAAIEAIEAGYTHYPPPLGDPELREAIAADLTRRSGRATTPGQVMVTAGAIGAIASALLAFLDEGDEALLPDPAYSAYAPLIRQAGALAVRVPLLPEDFTLDPEALEQAVTPRTKLVLLNNPANPTGVVYPRPQLEQLAETVLRHDLLIVCDEVYDRLTFGDAEFTSLLRLGQLADRTVYINSFSKTYAMTGWRIGYLAAPPGLLRGPSTVQMASSSGVNWPAQRAALSALREGQEPAEQMRAGYARRLAAMTDALRRIDGVTFPAPQGAFYVFAKFTTAERLTSRQLTQTLLEAGVAVRSGSEFGPGGEGYLRLSYSADIADIERGMATIAAVIAGL
jgi:aspartate aminotransferase